MNEEGEDLTAVRELIVHLEREAQAYRKAGSIGAAEKIERFHLHLVRWVECPVFGPRR